MPQFVPNIAKGKVKQFGELPLANDSVTWVLIQNAGMEGDEVFRDADNLAALVSGATNELDDAGYGRVSHAATITVTVSDTTDDVLIDDTTDPSFTITAGSPSAIGAVVACYDDDTTGGTDTNLIPFMVDKLAAPFTPTSNVAFTYQVASGGFVKAE